MKSIALVLLVPLVGACNVHSKNPANGDENVTIQADENGQIAFNLPIAQGQVKGPAGFMHNGNFDIDGVKLMPGSQVTGFSMFARDHGATVNMSFTAPASPDQVRSYFVDAFGKNGLEAKVDGNSVVGKSKDGNPFTIAVSPGPGGSQGQIVVHSKD